MKQGFFSSLFLIIKSLFLFVFAILYGIFGGGNQKKFDAGYKTFLATHNGRKFFFTTGDAHLRDLTKKHFVPLLPAGVAVVYVTKNAIESGFDARYMRAMMYRMKDKNRLPALFIIKDGTVYDLSVKNEMTASFNDYSKMKKLKQKMESFYGV